MYLIQLHHGGRLDEGFRVGYVDSIVPGVKGSKTPDDLPSMEDPHVIIVSLADCSDLAKSQGRHLFPWGQLNVPGGGWPPQFM